MIPPAHSGFAGWPVAMRPFCVVVAAWLQWNPGLSADERLSSVIRNVEDNEGLYQNLDARIRTHYDIGDRPPQKFEGGKEIVRKEVDTHFVSRTAFSGWKQRAPNLIRNRVSHHVTKCESSAAGGRNCS